MSILLFILFGIVVGFLARALMPGRQSMGLIGTAAVGILGSLIGGFVGNLISRAEPNQIEPAGIIGSVIGALVVLAIARSMGGRRGALRT